MEFSREQIRSSIFVAFKNNKTPQQAKVELDAALGKHAPKVWCIQNWYRRFRDGKADVKDEARSGRPKSAVTDKNVAAVREMVVADPNVTYRNIQGNVSIGSAAVNTILKKKLKCRKLVSRWIPHELTEEQKRDRVNWCKMMKRIYKNGRSRRVWDIVTGDETWISFREPKTKAQNMVWTFENQLPPTSVRPSRFVQKRMFAIFFRKSGFLHKRMLKKGATVTALWYKRTLIEMFKKIRKNRPRTGLRGIVLHQDNASSHTAEITFDFFQRKDIALTSHPDYSPDLAPLDFFYNDQIKKMLRGRKFSTESDLLRGIEIAIKNITKAQHRRCFDEWFERMDKCIKAKGVYFEKL